MMELLFSIGIFAVGMSLIAGLFPAAIKESEATVKDYEGPTICENGLAIVKARLEHDDAGGSGNDANSQIPGTLVSLDTTTIPIGVEDKNYR